MNNLGLFFALLQGVSIGFYFTFQKLGSTNINSALGAMIASVVAFIVNLFVLIGMKLNGQPITFSTKGIFLLVLMGLTAAGNDLFGLLAYSKGFQLIGSFITNGVYAIIVIFMGLILLKEPFNLGKIISIGLILAGMLLFQKSSM